MSVGRWRDQVRERIVNLLECCLKHRIPVVLKIGLLSVIELAAASTASQVKADPAGDVRRQLGRTDERAVILECDPSSVEEQVGVWRKEQTVCTVHALNAAGAFRPRFDVARPEKAQVSHSGQPALPLYVQEPALEQ